MPNLVDIGPVVLKRGFLNIFKMILLFHFYLPFEKGVALHLNKLESPPLKDVLFSSLGEIDLVVLNQKSFKYFQKKLTFSLSSPLGEGGGTSFQQT